MFNSIQVGDVIFFFSFLGSEFIPSENRQERDRYVYIETERNRGCGMYRRVLTSFEKWDFSRWKKKKIERKFARLDTFSLCLDMSIG
jgi:hypothetical protein